MKTVKKRMKEFKKDLSRWKEYDYVVINDNLQKCYKNIMKIIKRKNKIVFDKNYIRMHVKGLLN
jgi:guanylate kinase